MITLRETITISLRACRRDYLQGKATAAEAKRRQGLSSNWRSKSAA